MENKFGQVVLVSDNYTYEKQIKEILEEYDLITE